MKMHKKISALILSLVITASIPAAAFAAETSGTSTSNDNTVSSATEKVAESSNKNTENSDISYLFSENTSGNANLVASQEVIADNGKFQFIAVKTRNDDIFYIIIDKEKTENNVYFLNEVDTYDIKSLLNKNSEDSDISNETAVTEVSGKNAEKADSTEESTSEQASDNNFNLILIGGIAILAVIGFIIFKVKKGGFGKKKQADVPIDDDFEDDDEEINEDKEN